MNSRSSTPLIAREPARRTSDCGIPIISWLCLAAGGAPLAQPRRVSLFSIASLSRQLLPLRRPFFSLIKRLASGLDLPQAELPAARERPSVHERIPDKSRPFQLAPFNPDRFHYHQIAAN